MRESTVIFESCARVFMPYVLRVCLEFLKIARMFNRINPMTTPKLVRRTVRDSSHRTQPFYVIT